jgi:hypothetical protein
MTTRPRTRAPGVPIAAAAVLLVGSLTACGGDAEGDSSCPLILIFDGRQYQDARADQDPLPGTRVAGTGELPGCSDTNADDAGEPEQVEVWRLKGVDPDTAVAATLGGELQLFITDDAADACDIKYTRC